MLRKRAQGRAYNARFYILENLCRNQRDRRNRTHAAGVFSRFIFAYFLVVLRRREQHEIFPVRERVNGNLLTINIFFNNNLITCFFKDALHHDFLQGVFGFGKRHAHVDALAERKAVRFYNDWRPVFAHIRKRIIVLSEDLKFRRRNTRISHQAFRKCL